MFLTKYNPSENMNNFFKIMNNFPSIEENRVLSGFVPKVNTREGEFAYHVDIDLPGMKKEDINIDIHENSLSITGERKHKDELKEEDYYKVETSFGKFERVFTLPENVDIENISANSNEGVLEIVIPKQEKTVTKKRIEIK